MLNPETSGWFFFPLGASRGSRSIQGPLVWGLATLEMLWVEEFGPEFKELPPPKVQLASRKCSLRFSGTHGPRSLELL